MPQQQQQLQQQKQRQQQQTTTKQQKHHNTKEFPKQILATWVFLNNSLFNLVEVAQDEEEVASRCTR